MQGLTIWPELFLNWSGRVSHVRLVLGCLEGSLENGITPAAPCFLPTEARAAKTRMALAKLLLRCLDVVARSLHGLGWGGGVGVGWGWERGRLGVGEVFVELCGVACGRFACLLGCVCVCVRVRGWLAILVCCFRP